MIRDGADAGQPTFGGSSRDGQRAPDGRERDGRHARDEVRATEAVGTAEVAARVARPLRPSELLLQERPLAGRLWGHTVAARVSHQVAGNGKEKQD